ncbi:helix-turn-helix transcriptional regulator [Limnohabitans radicicola]|uniref:Helix-turn-helix domain-containing protein n=1 Tax=Limnohabitans radicicola TaxID=2771427 RepID=A0A927FCX4_9BURK|nr:helix-turn-helix domain-containing protein [Limnohabitans radicicola]MBD8049080.1 helix-turn-helix domain-containing protein [Limnohabitans radicicola]
MNLTDIGLIVQTRREALGLSQARLARLSGLSRATINQLENGSLVDLGTHRLLGLLHLLGMDLTAQTRTPRTKALALLSQTASVSYKTALMPDALAQALVSGELPDALLPQVSTLLDEAPLPLIVSGLEEVAQRTHTPPKTLWKNLTAWAQALQSPRTAWV